MLLPIFIVKSPVPLEPRVKLSSEPEDVAVIPTPPPEAAEVTTMPVAEVAALASTVSAGAVLPCLPTVSAVGELEVIVSVPDMESPVSTPTLVREEAVTGELSVVPVSVPAAAVTVISAVPLKLVPLIRRAV